MTDHDVFSTPGGQFDGGEKLFPPPPDTPCRSAHSLAGPPSAEETLPKQPKWNWCLGRIVVLDAETTGLWDPAKPPLPLELAMIVTTGDLEEIGRFGSVVGWSRTEFVRAGIHPEAEKMHDASGLMDQIGMHWIGRRVRPGIKEIERRMIDLLDETQRLPDGEWDSTPIVWAGASSSALDRPLIRRYMPELYRKIHYRTIDISSERLVFKNWLNLDLERDYVSVHRAMKDCEDALNCLRRLKRALGEIKQIMAFDLRPPAAAPPAQRPTM